MSGLLFRKPKSDSTAFITAPPEGELWYNAFPSNAAGPLRVQGAKDISHDKRTAFSSFFGHGKRSAEAGAFKQAHMTPSGVPGVLNLAVVDTSGKPIPFAPFNWNGRQMLTDAQGIIKYVERDYFQTAISLENERIKYVTQMISLVAGQPSENVIALFGYDFYKALAGCDSPEHEQALYAQRLYESYLHMAGLDPAVIKGKKFVFRRYSNAECSPEVMCNFGDNDPEWSRAFNKLSLLIEFHPSAILFDHGTLNPLDSSGQVYGDSGHSNAGPMDSQAQGIADATAGAKLEDVYKDSNRTNLSSADFKTLNRARSRDVNTYRGP